MELSRYEQETIINYNEAEKTAAVYTHNKSLRRNWNDCSRSGRRNAGLRRQAGAAPLLSTSSRKRGFESLRPAL